MKTGKRQYEIPLGDVDGYMPEAVYEVALRAIVERLEALVDAVDRHREALIAMKGSQ